MRHAFRRTTNFRRGRRPIRRGRGRRTTLNRVRKIGYRL